jgi:histidyl-tRNA synthetase
LHINSRKILKGLMEATGVAEHEKFILITIDKLDKIGLEEVRKLLITKVPEAAVSNLLEAYTYEGSTANKSVRLKSILQSSVAGMEGIDDIETVLGSIKIAGVSTEHIVLDISLARGLDYYTGIIFEAKAPPGIKIGSIGGGGRYDDLTGLFGVPGIPGVGISFGVDRIYDVMEELQLFPEEALTGTHALFFNMNEGMEVILPLMQQLREKGIPVELFHEPAKFDKQFRYAEKKKIPYAVIIGSKEVADNSVVVKDIRTGKQETIPLANLEKSLFI